ncbi:MAG: glycogen/starch/alpha-glucan phosphorylase [Bacilli bacterium]|nr:glycogen/starch/alpha-glucan phosphorylase [Bacilli bacterium]
MNDYIRELVETNLAKSFGVQLSEANLDQLYRACATTINDILRQKRKNFNHRVKQTKSRRVYYLSMEFLMGRSFKNNIYNLDLVNEFSSVLESIGYSLEDLYQYEPDAGLGNGGLGRLGACYMDALATGDYPAMGYSLRYEYGLFKQKIINNWQTELPDVWLPGGEVWLTVRSDKNYTVSFGGRIETQVIDGKTLYRHVDAQTIEAVPYDMMVSGAESEAVSVLRLWKSNNIHRFDLNSFSQGDYIKAMKDSTEAELITKILYPTDDHPGGKELRLKQQYFLVSASIQNIIADHIRYYGDIHLFPKYVAIHINDTHPALCIPELMRIFMDEYHIPFETAWDYVTKSVSYTNHTVMAEALERWDEGLLRTMLPRIYMILEQINEHFLAEAKCLGKNKDECRGISIFEEHQVRMANLCIIGSHMVNGVSKLHSDIIKKSVFGNFYQLSPQKFTNVTNGIAYRRWLYQSNPLLARFIEEKIGHTVYKDASQLKELLAYVEDDETLKKIEEIKFRNKVQFSKYFYQKTGIVINPKTRFDVQIKRFHEYKRQLLNALRIVALYLQLEENPQILVTPQTFIFGGKAAPGYYQAKEVIELINAISLDLSKRPDIKEKLNVVFVEDYNVSVAEMLIPASEVSEQISLAGKEASGTSNMKFMMNGALTFGTLDGANVEICELVGEDNIFIFGMKTEEVEALWAKGYRSMDYYEQDPLIHKVIDRLNRGFSGKSFENISNYLLGKYPVADPFMCLADFNSFMATYETMDKRYQNKREWNKMALINIASSGTFSADRSIKEYAKKIWHLKAVKNDETHSV